MIVTGGISVTTAGMSVTGGMTVQNSGFSVTGGLTINNNGAFILGGMAVTGGASVQIGGMYITGGLTVQGGLTVFGNTYLEFTATTSDRRLKQDISPLKNSLSKVTKLRGVYFKWTKNGPSGDKVDSDRHLGVIAQDVQAVFPDIVDTIHDGQYLGVRYSELIPVLIEAVRELDDQISEHHELYLSADETINETVNSLIKQVTTLTDENRIIRKELADLKALVTKLVLNQELQ
jgi:hypothetical protein